MELDGKRAIVTGAGSGIGRATALGLAAAGAAVAVVDVRPDAAVDTAAAIEQNRGRALALPTDVTQRAEVEAMVERVQAAWGGVDILMNNAGGSLTSRFLDLREDEWDHVVDLNLKAAYLCAQPAARVMVGQRAGRIVNVSSNYGVTGSAPRAHYSAAKAGVIGLTKALALELAPYGITVNAVAPGLVPGPRQSSSEEYREAVRQMVPLGRLGQPEDIAHAIVFLASPGAAWISGEVLRVDGGYLAGRPLPVARSNH